MIENVFLWEYFTLSHTFRADPSGFWWDSNQFRLESRIRADPSENKIK